MVLGFADEMKMLGENIAASCDMRLKSVKDIIKDTHSTLKQFHTDRMHISEEQRTELARFKKNLMNETHAFLNEFKVDFEKMAEEMHKMLSSYYKGEIKKPVHDMLSSSHNEMKKLANEFHQAHNAWRSFSRSMDEKRHIIHAPETIAPKADVSRKRSKRKRKYSRKK